MICLTELRVVEHRPQPTGKTSRRALMTGILYRSICLCDASNSHFTLQRRAASFVDKASMVAMLYPTNNENGLAATMLRSSVITSISGLKAMFVASACARIFSAHTLKAGTMPTAPWRGAKNLVDPRRQAKHMGHLSSTSRTTHFRDNLSSTSKTAHTACTLLCRGCPAPFQSPPPPGPIHTRGAAGFHENLLCSLFDGLRHQTKQH